MLNLIGYHGTKRAYGEIIVSTRKFQVSGTYKDWLGRGVYFFENDRHQAYMFAKFKDSRSGLPHEQICVIEANLTSDNCIDLLRDYDRKRILCYANKLREKIDEAAAQEPAIKNWNHKEGFVLDMLYELEPYDIVRAAYRVPRQKVDGVCEFEPIQIQICVKNTDCIKCDSVCEVNCDDYK